MKRVLTKDEEWEIAIAYLGGILIREVSEHYVLSVSGVHRVLDRMGVEKDRLRAKRKKESVQ